MWQYTSSGLVDGINGRTDMNIMYLKITDEPTSQNIEDLKPQEPKTEDPKSDTSSTGEKNPAEPQT